MKKRNKIIAIVAAITVAVGLIIAFSAAAVAGFDNYRLFGVKRQDVIHTPEGEFHSVYVSARDSDVKLMPSDGELKIICRGETDELSYAVEIVDGILQVMLKDARSWYDYISFAPSRLEVLIYLPGSYNNVDIKATSGDVSMLGLSAASVSVGTTSGEVDITGVRLSGELNVKCTSGDVEIEGSDAAEIRIETRSGDVEASFLTSKTYDLHTSSGEIERPLSNSGNLCYIRTRSGDIEVE